MEIAEQSHTSIISFWKYFLVIASSGIALSILLLLFGIWRGGERFVRAIDSFRLPSRSITTRVDLSHSIVDRLSGVSELTTAEFVMDSIVPAAREQKIGEFVLGTTRLIYIARGEVKAGIDLSNLSADNVEIIADTVRIHLPPPEILDSKIDVNRSRVYDYDRGFLGLGPDVAPQLQTLAQRRTLETIVATACERGILEEANERAVLSLTQLLNAFGYAAVEVVTSTPSLPGCNGVSN